MERGQAPRVRPRGGDGIQAPRALRPWLAPAAGAVAVALPLAVAPAAAADGPERLVGAAGILGVLLLAVGLAVPWALLVPWALVALGAEYAVSLTLRGEEVDTRSPLYGAGLLLVAELAYWALELRRSARPEGDVALLRVLGTIGAAAGAIVVGALVLAATAVDLGSGVVLEVVGVAGAVAVLGLVARLAWSERDASPR
jgi:hypothetical protein